MEKEFIQIINEHQGIIFSVCRMYCTEKADIEDLFQEIVLQLWRSFPRFNRTAKVSTWMYRIALNTAITGIRRRSSRPVFSAISLDQENHAEPPPGRMDIEYNRELWKAIYSLSKFDRSLLLLYLEERPYSEMAEILGLTESNIGVKLNRIKKKLKTILNP
ncbi:RNA polymerase sigma factor [Chitinophaga tropicalis]|uniref:Sigma-70 family RNA polymerase sigma factor n=1 Tax=Chitinophaga tropicalis TaxID=2683588 RepID=A0A7K1U0W6_9BACT|nr:sigma-70 family RNA polymerase sigma factor [Chitinophaga tropicalis]MVT08011.1 sigma-70 family RNA polymerase sigma factor [Chitinophaga tropicalis]